MISGNQWIVGLLIFLGAMIFSGPANAQVSGLCSNCHTMHNSQDGSVVDSDGPSGNLLATDCVGCHSSTDTGTIKILGGSHIPIVYNQQEPSQPLAGGNFYWVAHDGGDAYGHNVYGISVQDGTLMDAPGRRVDPSCQVCHSSLATPDPRNGCKGCHYPRHHADDSAIVVDGTGGWYRFLGDNPAMNPSDPDSLPLTGVIGIEAGDWEQNPSSISHNVYQGTTTVYSYQPGGFSGAEYLRENSIGSFCAGCHGLFHHEMNEGQPNFYTAGDVSGAWIRHPSDVVIPAGTTEYADYTVYNPLAPVAKSTVVTAGDANFDTVTPGSDVVTCISCHRAHGSPYPDMLRWDYETDCKTGTPNSNCGCFTCHTAKDD